MYSSPCKSKHLIYKCGFTNSRLLKSFLTLIQKRDTLISLAFRFSYVLPPLTVLHFFFLSLLCIVFVPSVIIIFLSSSSPLFLYVLHFSYVLSYAIAKVMLHWESFCLLSVVPSSSLQPPCSVIYLHFIEEFLFAFFGLPLG